MQQEVGGKTVNQALAVFLPVKNKMSKEESDGLFGLVAKFRAMGVGETQALADAKEELARQEKRLDREVEEKRLIVEEKRLDREVEEKRLALVATIVQDTKLTQAERDAVLAVVSKPGHSYIHLCRSFLLGFAILWIVKYCLTVIIPSFLCWSRCLCTYLFLFPCTRFNSAHLS
jgi:hypothetical protein